MSFAKASLQLFCISFGNIFVSPSIYLHKEFPVRNTLSSYFFTVTREATELDFSISNIITRTIIFLEYAQPFFLHFSLQGRLYLPDCESLGYMEGFRSIAGSHVFSYINKMDLGSFLFTLKRHGVNYSPVSAQFS